MTITISSETEIVNQSLARLTEEAIYSLDDTSKRARLANSLYYQAINYVLSYNWPFARRIKKLNEISGLDTEDKLFTYVHQEPSDCHHVIDLLPLGRGHRWEKIGRQIHSDLDGPRALYITREISVVNFSGPFVNSLHIYLAALLAGPLTQNEELVNQLRAEFAQSLYENLRMDASIGSKHLDHDLDPNNDTFVTGDDHVTKIPDDLSKRYLLPEG